MQVSTVGGFESGSECGGTSTLTLLEDAILASKALPLLPQPTQSFGPPRAVALVRVHNWKQGMKEARDVRRRHEREAGATSGISGG